jgi:hypothetical protein
MILVIFPVALLCGKLAKTLWQVQDDCKPGGVFWFLLTSEACFSQTAINFQRFKACISVKKVITVSNVFMYDEVISEKHRFQMSYNRAAFLLVSNHARLRLFNTALDSPLPWVRSLAQIPNPASLIHTAQGRNISHRRSYGN